MPLSGFLLALAAVLLAASPSWAAPDPFVGKWKIDASRSRVIDEMQVKSLGAKRYVFNFGPGQVDTIAVDGTDQPALMGSTLAVTPKGPNSWEVVRKKGGRRLLRALWTLSADGRTLSDAFTGYADDSKPTETHLTYRRAGGGDGFAGTWDSVTVGMDPSIELEIKPYGAHGLAFASSGLPMSLNLELDGKGHVGANPAVATAVYSGRRLNRCKLAITARLQGKVTGRRQVTLSKDQKTLIMTIRLAGDRQPGDVYVFERA